ncbi:hypothetical protein F4775DRAFT_603671, partial [Biscogniauxia sp. FL1348]
LINPRCYTSVHNQLHPASSRLHLTYLIHPLAYAHSCAPVANMTSEQLAAVLAKAEKSFNALRKAEEALREMQKPGNMIAYGMLCLALIGSACFLWLRGKKHDEPRPQPPPASPEPSDVDELTETEEEDLVDRDLVDRIAAENHAKQHAIFSDFHHRFPEYICEEGDECCSECGACHERAEFGAWIY